MASARLILLNWDSDRADYEQIGNLLWTNSTLASPAMVLVIADEYRAEQAVTLFRMGVDEYVGRSDHAEKLQGVLGQLLTGRETAASTQARTLAAALAGTRAASSIAAVGRDRIGCLRFVVSRPDSRIAQRHFRWLIESIADDGPDSVPPGSCPESAAQTRDSGRVESGALRRTLGIRAGAGARRSSPSGATPAFTSRSRLWYLA